jgi:LPXTG-motif cell wall-anchored protein
VQGFQNAASAGLQVGAGQSGAQLPPGTPQQVVDLGLKTFHEAFTNAMHSTMVLPLGVLALAALSVLFVKRRKRNGVIPAQAEPAESSPAHAG